MYNKFIIKSLLFSIITLLLACHADPDIATLEKQGLESGIRKDSLFYNLYLSMPKQEFFDSTHALNNRKLVHESPKFEVQMDITGLTYPAVMEFFPRFADGKIAVMDMKFHYPSWAPWNKDRQSDKLIKEVVALMQKWYGGDFIIAKDPETNKLSYFQVNGNRKIEIFSQDEMVVKVIITDLTANKIK